MYTFAYYGTFGKYNTESYISIALEKLGHTIIKLPKSSKNLPSCDFRLFAKLDSNYIIQNSKEPTVCWQFDLFRNYPGRSLNAPHFKADIVITTDGGDPFHTIRQGIYKPEKIMMESTDYSYDVIFVGSPYFYREKLIKENNCTLIQMVILPHFL